MDAERSLEQMKLAVIEVLDRDGHCRQVVPIFRWPAAIGRSVECDVVLDDPFTAAHHATLDEREGVLGLRAGESVNGVSLGKRQLSVHEHVDLATGDMFRVGNTVLRVRRVSDSLAPERALLPETRTRWVSLVVLVTALGVWTVVHQWLQTDPGGRVIDYVTTLIGAVLALVVWSGLWSLGSRLFRRRFDYWKHVRIATSYSLASDAAAALLPILAYVLGWVWPSRIAGLAYAGLLCAMVLAHLTLMLPGQRKVLAIVMSTLFAAGTALYLTRNYQTQHRVFTELYVTTLAPPILRLAAPVPVDRFIDETRALKASLDRQAKDDESTNDSVDDDDE